jgi:hypothetical protein
MTALAEDLDLSWVTFTDDFEDEPCDGLTEQCGQEAVVVAFWDRPCGHGPDESSLCAEHRDELAVMAEQVLYFRCMTCPEKVVLLRMEPIR